MIRHIPPLPPTGLKLTSALASMAFVCLLPAWVSAHGGFDERIEAGNQDVASDPSDPQPRLVRAELHRRHGDFTAALRDLDDASRLSPELRSIDYFRGLVYLDADRHVQAEATLWRFLERELRHPAVRAARASALRQLERPLDAAHEYDLVIAQVGRTEEAKQSFTLALAELDKLSRQRRRTSAMSRPGAEIRASMAGLANPPPQSTP